MDRRIRTLFRELGEISKKQKGSKDKNAAKAQIKKKQDELLKIIKDINSVESEDDSDSENEGPFVFNQASKDLWYNWSNSVGNKFTAVSYSAGTTYLFQNKNPLQLPQVFIFGNNQFNVEKQEKPLYNLTLVAEGIRSVLLIDDVEDPYVLIGTFSYPKQGVIPKADIYRWNFMSNKLAKLLTIDGTNSIRTMIRYKSMDKDVLFFSAQTDAGAAQFLSSIYTAQMTDVTTQNTVQFSATILSLNNNYIFGNVWDFYIDADTIWISIPQITQDPKKLSGFSTKGRAYYQNINSFFKGLINVDIIPVIGNDLYKPGFDVSSLSAFQFQTTPNSDLVYIYSVSDFLYQFLSVNGKINLAEKLAGNFEDGVRELRELAANLDLAGSRIFTVKKSDLFKGTNPSVTTVLGEAPIGTINGSFTNNGYNNFLNIYTWTSTTDGKNMYFGTLDVRQEAYLALVEILINALGLEILRPILLAAPEEIVITVTEFFLNIDFSIPIDFKEKQLHFDVIKVDDKGVFSKITSNGFKRANPSLPDDGVRNLDIVQNGKDKILITGSTCYQAENSAKIYTLKLK